MTWKIQRNYAPFDPFFNDVVLLLHGDGENGGTIFTDSSLYNNTVTASFNPDSTYMTTSTAQSKFGGSSMHFDNFTSREDNFLTVTNAEFALGDTYTIEGWVRLDVVGGANARNCLCAIGVSNDEGSVSIYQENNEIRARAENITLITTSLPTALQWQHWALVVDNTFGTFYLDGVNIGTQAGIPTITDTTCTIGSISSVSGQFGAYHTDGYIDELRITKGVARYTANFTPPTAAFPDQ